MGKVIFRKIGGRIVPIKIGSVNDPLHTPGVIGRKITATHVTDKTRIGTMHVTASKKGVSADVVNVAVEKKFQGHGISRQLYQHAQKLMGRIGKKFMRSSELQHVAQAKIRAKASFPGPRGKSGTRFIGTGFGPYGEQNKKVNLREAMGIIKNPGKNGQTVSATSMIPKKFRGRKK